MLLIANMSIFHHCERRNRKNWRGLPGDTDQAEAAGGRASAHRRLLPGLSEVFLDHVAIGLEPIRRFDKLAATDGPYLDPPAPFMIPARLLHRWRNTAKGKVRFFRNWVLHICGGRISCFLALDRVAKCLGM